MFLNKRAKGITEPKAAEREKKLIVKTKSDMKKANEQVAKMHNISPEAASQISSIESTYPNEGPAQQASELQNCCSPKEYTKLWFYWPHLLHSLGAASLLGPFKKVGLVIGIKRK